MPLEYFDKFNSFNRRGKPAIINLDKEGRINFSVEAVKLLKLEEGMPITFAYDKKDTEIIYFHKSDAGIPLKATSTLKGTLRLSVYCRPLAEKLLKFFKYDHNHSFLLTEETTLMEGKKMWFFLKYKNRPTA